MKKIVKILCGFLMAVSMFSVVKITSITSKADNTITMLRLYNTRSGEHLYTGDASERDWLVKNIPDWKYEGVAWIAPASSSIPVFRLYNPRSSDHHYTADIKERDWLVNTIGDWKYEGIGWYSATTADAEPIYRHYNPSFFTGSHHYTADKAESDLIVAKYGWRYEGIAWYGLAGSAPKYNPPSTIVKPVTPPFYSQTDGRWANTKIGGYTMGATACGCCTMAMIIQARVGGTVLPTDIANYLHSVGLYNSPNCFGTNGASFITAGKKYGLASQGIGSYDAFVSALSQGKLIAMQVVGAPFVEAGASHAMVIYGYDNGTVNVLDPLGGRCNGQYSASDIWNHQTNVPTDLDQGVPGFAF